MRPNEENRRDYHILIWKDKYGDYIFLDDAFKHSDNFKGLCGTRMKFHTEDEYERDRKNVIDDGWLEDLWIEAVKAHRTTLWLDEWSEDVLEEDDDYPYDPSYRCEWRIDEALEIIDKHEYEETGIHATSEFSDCTWWGRCFDEEMLKRSYWEWVEPINFRTLKRLYNAYEK